MSVKLTPREELYEALSTAVYVLVLLLVLTGIPLVILAWRTL